MRIPLALMILLLCALMCSADNIYIKYKYHDLKLPVDIIVIDTKISADSWVVINTTVVPALFKVRTVAQLTYELNSYLLGIIYDTAEFIDWYTYQKLDTMAYDEFDKVFQTSIQLCAPCDISDTITKDVINVGIDLELQRKLTLISDEEERTSLTDEYDAMKIKEVSIQEVLK